MVSRREFVLSGIAVSALPTIASDVPAAASAHPTLDGRLYKAIYDARFPASVAYGREATCRGVPVAAIHGDMTDLWYHDLYPQWRREPAAIAGLTAHGPLFCLERLSWDFDMRVAFREQQPGELIYWVIAPRSRS